MLGAPECYGQSSTASDDPVLPHDLRVPSGRELGGTRLRRVIDVDDAESLAVALGPLEVVQERPEEIAAQVEAFGHGAVERDQIIAQVLAAVEVEDRAAGGDLVVEGRAILGDVEGPDAEDLGRVADGPVERLRRDVDPRQVAPRELAGEGEHLGAAVGAGADE